MFLKKPLALAVCAFASSHSYALEPASFGSSGVSFTPTLNLSYLYDDNIRATQNALSSKVTTINPQLALNMDSAKSTFSALYSYSRRIYEEDSVDPLTDYSFSANSTYAFDVRNNLKVSTGLNKTENIANATQVGETDKMKNFNLGAVYVYGAPSATGNLEFGLSMDNIRAQDQINAALERDSGAANLLFSVRGAGTTRLLAEAQIVQHHYISAGYKDGANYTGRIGVRWEATAKTSGEVKIGYERKEFDDSAMDGSELVNWAAQITWQPRTYSTFTLSSSQRIDEGNYGASSVDVRENSLDWRHDWGNRIQSNVMAAYSSKEYSNGRNDDARNFSIRLDYQVRRWMDIGIGYIFSDQNSSDIDYDYDREQVFAGLSASF
ncbi:outer membrane beta-barrel protein [Thiomicrorhabdus sp. 6S3-12]|uniref:outer membrane beta-barrel protein n=1 Tax=Thiomicrorhabdus sp. 6S3-12 TaxID=2819681 RepID=UPI001AACEA2D|nr:outer membrane beta-barrel protein [Thiomicrorhabdus sp. 6S3-12]MBO1923330.1 outer membrane beta-barrel protein [Thiomicrorhabdus sp. 6S3-12]